jgi:nucleotide-binding universal stress UspA family protein
MADTSDPPRNRELRTILTGFDGSDQAHDALRLAAAIADTTGAELIVGAVEVNDPFYGFDKPGLQHMFDLRFDEASRALGGRHFARAALSASSAGDGLLRLVDETEADLLVLGSTHRGLLGRVMPGSTATALLSSAPCPIAVAPVGFGTRAHAGFGLIGVGYDGGDESKAALREAEWWATRLEAAIRLIAVVAPQPLVRDNGALATVTRHNLAEQLEIGASTVDDSIDVETVLRDGDPAPVLAEQGVGLDLLILGSRSYGPVRRVLLGAVSSEVMRTAPCPVLVVPRSAVEDAKIHNRRSERSLTWNAGS